MVSRSCVVFLLLKHECLNVKPEAPLHPFSITQEGIGSAACFCDRAFPPTVFCPVAWCPGCDVMAATGGAVP